MKYFSAVILAYFVATVDHENFGVIIIIIIDTVQESIRL